MATDKDYIKALVGLFGDAGVTYRAMMGEYVLYCGGKVFALVCGNTLFIKITDASCELLKDRPIGLPYQGAKPMFILHAPEKCPFLGELALRVSAELPFPSKKRRS